ncbi:hypothetical protein E6H22_04565 [Candidatus Bathyarchaeota archaeon]|nr:MAG: hypothetical protein E6H22_04565 [Candidatus Bathyarchaeota archaeon]
MSMNLCPKCHKPIRIPQDEVIVIRTKVGRNKFVDHMAHKVCPTDQAVASQVGGQEYCTNCGHNRTLHNPNCGYSSFGYECDCKDFRK